MGKVKKYKQFINPKLLFFRTNDVTLSSSRAHHHNSRPKHEAFSASRHSLETGAQLPHSQVNNQEQQQQQPPQQHHNNLLFVQNVQHHASSTHHSNINMAFQPKHRDGPRAFASMSQLDVLMGTPSRGRRSTEGEMLEKPLIMNKVRFPNEWIKIPKSEAKRNVKKQTCFDLCNWVWNLPELACIKYTCEK